MSKNIWQEYKLTLKKHLVKLITFQEGKSNSGVLDNLNFSSGHVKKALSGEGILTNFY